MKHQINNPIEIDIYEEELKKLRTNHTRLVVTPEGNVIPKYSPVVMELISHVESLIEEYQDDRRIS